MKLTTRQLAALVQARRQSPAKKSQRALGSQTSSVVRTYVKQVRKVT